ncbi:unnamed protein product [Clavelina lepadiformis]|uniref:Uncharacterized protein n=1 Tax=Clavelina lepadiformis TaxID=159417 RepID=A0ABP0FZQ2_CLALP
MCSSSFTLLSMAYLMSGTSFLLVFVALNSNDWIKICYEHDDNPARFNPDMSRLLVPKEILQTFKTCFKFGLQKGELQLSKDGVTEVVEYILLRQPIGVKISFAFLVTGLLFQIKAFGLHMFVMYRKIKLLKTDKIHLIALIFMGAAVVMFLGGNICYSATQDDNVYRGRETFQKDYFSQIAEDNLTFGLRLSRVERSVARWNSDARNVIKRSWILKYDIGLTMSWVAVVLSKLAIWCSASAYRASRSSDVPEDV